MNYHKVIEATRHDFLCYKLCTSLCNVISYINVYEEVVCTCLLCQPSRSLMLAKSPIMLSTDIPATLMTYLYICNGIYFSYVVYITMIIRILCLTGLDRFIPVYSYKLLMSQTHRQQDNKISVMVYFGQKVDRVITDIFTVTGHCIRD